MTEKFACCFCGKIIEPVSPDIGALLYTVNWDKPRADQYDQSLFCHAACLQSRLHPSAKLYILSLVSNEPLTAEEMSRLPDILR
jgi:hypothetical protein